MNNFNVYMFILVHFNIKFNNFRKQKRYVINPAIHDIQNYQNLIKESNKTSVYNL